MCGGDLRGINLHGLYIPMMLLKQHMYAHSICYLPLGIWITPPLKQQHHTFMNDDSNAKLAALAAALAASTSSARAAFNGATSVLFVLLNKQLTSSVFCLALISMLRSLPVSQITSPVFSFMTTHLN